MTLTSRKSRLLDLAEKAWVYFLTAIKTPRDLPFISWKVFVEGVHLGELLKLNRFKKWVKASGIETLIDVGANTGQFASALAAMLPKVSIYAFEPIAECCSIVSKRFARHEKFTIFCAALGDAKGEATFWKHGFSESSSLLPMSTLHKEAFPWTSENLSIKVDVKRLDDYLGSMDLSPRVLLKIDVQGFEGKVLKGGAKVLSKVDYIIVEISYHNLYEGQSTFHSVYQFLLSHGFVFAGSLDDLVSPLDGSILQADALFVRR